METRQSGKLQKTGTRRRARWIYLSVIVSGRFASCTFCLYFDALPRHCVHVRFHSFVSCILIVHPNLDTMIIYTTAGFHCPLYQLDYFLITQIIHRTRFTYRQVIGTLDWNKMANSRVCGFHRNQKTGDV
jgi:hypothetical protein